MPCIQNHVSSLYAANTPSSFSCTSAFLFLLTSARGLLDLKRTNEQKQKMFSAGRVFASRVVARGALAHSVKPLSALRATAQPQTFRYFSAQVRYDLLSFVLVSFHFG